MIYVIGEKPDGIVKIGMSGLPIKRLRSIQTSYPRKLIILATFDGDRDTESMLHESFQSLRTGGEWFDFSGHDAVTEVSLALGRSPHGDRYAVPLDLTQANRRRLLRMPPEPPENRPYSMTKLETWEALAMDRDTSRAEIVTLMFLTACADRDGVVVGTLDQIADRIGYNRTSTADALNSLIERKLLDKLRRSMYRIPEHVCTPANLLARTGV